MSSPLDRARMLLQVERPAEAAREIAAALSQSPDDAHAHALMALALAAQDEPRQARESAQRAIALAPDWAYTHYVLGTILCRRDEDAEALKSAREAVRLDPDDADHHALEASCLAGLSRWKDMLAAAERGLALDPTHVGCLNLRANALRQLGRADEAAEALDTALSAEPENPYSHTSYGFARLQRGEHQAAIEHFREALRLDPTHEDARAGLVEALKAQNPLYRPILWWILWSSRRTGTQLMIGAFVVIFGLRALRRAVAGNPPLEILVILLGLAYALVVWTSWVGQSLFDVLLWLRRDTRPLLPRRETVAAVAVGSTVLLAPLAGLALASMGRTLEGLVTGCALLAVAVPVSGGLAVRNPTARIVGVVIAAAILLLAIAGALAHLGAPPQGDLSGRASATESPGMILSSFAIGAAMLSTWVFPLLQRAKSRS
jgi:tetratricopeptide (TPR) repeat protein